MNESGIKGKWNEIKDNVKDAWNKATDAKSAEIKKDFVNKDYSAAASKAKEKLADLKPDVDEIKTSFTNGTKKAEYLKDKVGDTAKKGFDSVKGNINKPDSFENRV